MRNKLRMLGRFVILAGLLVAVGFIQTEDRLPQPRTVTLEILGGLEVPVMADVVWYDHGLNPERFYRQLDLTPNSKLELPTAAVPTQLWRFVQKKILTKFDRWSGCENCDGPIVHVSLRLRRKFVPPEKMRLAQNQRTEGDNLILEVSLIPDERQFETRAFEPRDIQKLLIEAKALVQRETRFIPPGDVRP
jgi:hypothetical protein